MTQRVLRLYGGRRAEMVRRTHHGGDQSHRVIGALAVAQGTAEALTQSWEAIDDSARRRLVELVLDQIIDAAEAADQRPRLRAV